MKKSPLVMSFVSAIFAIAAAVLLIFLPNLGTELSNYVSSDFITNAINNLWPALKATITFSIGRPVVSGIVVGLLGIQFVFWIWHFIVLIATRRPNSLSINIFWIIFGLVSTWVLFTFIGYVDANTGYIFNGTVGSAEVHNGVSLLKALFTENFANHAAAIFLLLGIALLAALGYIFGLISIIGALADDIKNPNEKDDEEFTSLDEEEVAGKKGKKGKKESSKVKQDEEGEGKQDEKNPLIVQHINYGGQPQPTYPQPAYYWPQPPYYPPQPAPAPEKKEEKPTLTENDVKRIVEESLSSQQAAIIAALKENQQPVEAKPVVEEKLDERPLTAKELRSIIKNELRDHDHPEELMPLTDEQCRSLIREELSEYYASTRPQDEKVEETPEDSAKPAEEETKSDVEEELMTADELSKMIRNEVVQVLDESKEGKEEITLDSIKQIINEEIAKSKENDPAPVTIEEISTAISDEIAPLKETEEEQNKKIDALNQQYSKIDGLAEQCAKIDALSEQCAKIDDLSKQYAEKVEEDKAKEEETKTAIENVKASQLSADDIRKIIADELAKIPAPAPVETEPEPTPVEEIPEPVAPEEPVADNAVTEEKVVERVPFAERVLNLDEDIKDAYNELKAEALSYGLKSRLSISGDTFRLHTKTYLKIVVAGKGLKLYMALDPHDYKDSPIPVKDVGVKNVYKDIPLAFKVKSGLSLKRAKQLIKDACEKDDLVKGDITPLNYISQLASYRVAGTDEEDIEENDD